MANRWASPNNLYERKDINEELKLIDFSNTDYVTPSGNIFKLYEGKGYYKKTLSVNTYNGYVYCNITKKDGKNINKRVHKLVALNYVENPNPEKLLVVGHFDNDKTNNHFSNLYWTTTQDNTQKAIDEDLVYYATGIENENSQPLKVLFNDKTIAVYGSICEADRSIENVSKSYLARAITQDEHYKPRGKKYKYLSMTKEEYQQSPDESKNNKLIENKVIKNMTIFEAIHITTGEKVISNNQKEFARNYGLEQALISKAIKENNTYNNWKFKLIETTTYKESTAYKNYINTVDEVTIKNIKTNEVKTFITKQELKDYFGLKGHDLLQYKNNNQLIFSEWQIIDELINV